MLTRKIISPHIAPAGIGLGLAAESGSQACVALAGEAYPVWNKPCWWLVSKYSFRNTKSINQIKIFAQ